MGAMGEMGTPGSQIQISTESPGQNCPAGGERIDVGIPGDGGFVIEQTAYVCKDGVTSDASAGDASSADGAAGGGADAVDAAGGTSLGIRTVFTVVLSNHDYQEVIGSPNAPYVNSLVSRYGLATNYMDSGVHPDLPNNLEMVSGAIQYSGFIDVGPTTLPFPIQADNLGHQFRLAGVPWRSYQESVVGPCSLSSSGAYATYHNPFLYFMDVQGDTAYCTDTNVDYSELPTDLASDLYRYIWITPNLNHDGHDPVTDPVSALVNSDQWLSTEIPKLMASAGYQNGGVIFITWDQAEGRNGDSGDQVPMIVVTENIKSAGYRSAVPYSHANYLATVEAIFGLPRLGAAAGATVMSEFFR
jgi:hypothetical protein